MGKDNKTERIFRVTTLGDRQSPIELRIYGGKGVCRLTHLDPFVAFRNTLEKFVQNTCQRKIVISDDEMLRVVELIELGARTS